jgi:hypothetical protein
VGCDGLCVSESHIVGILAVWGALRKDLRGWWWEEKGGEGEVLPGVRMWDIWLVECAREVYKFCVVVATLRREQTRCGALRFGTGETPVDG